MKKENPKLQAALRTVTGRKVKQLRRAGQIPATIYGHKFEPISIQVVALELNKIFEHAGESSLVEVHIGEEKYPVIFKNPQYHPITGELIHIDCYKVNLKEKIITTVPVELIGEAPATKVGNILMHILSEIEIEALPADLPEKIEVDVSALAEVDNKITVADLIIDREKIEVKNAPEQVVALIEAPKVEEEPVVEEVSPEDVPATAQKAEGEGEGGAPASEASEDTSEK